MLYGYGSFSNSATPSYRPDVPAWLERGGIFATANIRGGGAHGEGWHRGGMLANKQNSFDDFIAVAEDLIKRGYTSPAKLAIQGGSNGGLLVGAVVNQKPDLFAAALPAAGVMDVLRYDKFISGAAWIAEYGAPSDPLMFPILYRYLHCTTWRPVFAIRRLWWRRRPTTIAWCRAIHTNTWHRCRQPKAANGPVLMKVEREGSHAYRPTDRLIAERADAWAFVDRLDGDGCDGRSGR